MQLLDQYLIDLNEEIVDINYELAKDSGIPEEAYSPDAFKIDDFKRRVTDLLDSIERNV